MNWHFFQPLIEELLNQGVPSQTIAGLLLFPLITLLIAGSRYLIGIRGLGMFFPAVLAVIFLNLGLANGLILFFLVLIVVTLGRILTLKLHLHYLARMSLLIWLVSLGIFLSLFWVNNPLFPLLVLILLGENLVEVQITKGRKEAFKLVLETLILSFISFFLLSLETLQNLVLSQPEIFLILTALGNIFLGRFTGLRLLEYKRFSRLLK
ncbi:MAG: 7TM domain-containing protein [Microgenomates group bacterium]